MEEVLPVNLIVLRMGNAGEGATVLKFNIGDNHRDSSIDISRNGIPLTAAYKTPA